MAAIQLFVFEMFATPWFKFAAFPVISIVVMLVLKIYSRPHTVGAFTRENLAVGLELTGTAALLLLTATYEYASKDSARSDPNALANVFGSAALFGLMLFLASMLASTVSRWGWTVRPGSTPELNIWVGMLLPFGAGVLSIYALVEMTGTLF